MFWAIECSEGLQAVEEGSAEPRFIAYENKSDREKFLKNDYRCFGMPYPTRKPITKREVDKLRKEWGIGTYKRIGRYSSFPSDPRCVTVERF